MSRNNVFLSGCVQNLATTGRYCIPYGLPDIETTVLVKLTS